MAEDEQQRATGPGRGWRRRREPVPADPGGAQDDDPGPEGDDGSAGVREPRHPKPSGPVSGAGVKPDPEPELVVSLPDPRYT